MHTVGDPAPEPESALPVAEGATPDVRVATFLLIAPVEVAAPAAVGGTKISDGGRFASRSSSRTQILTYDLVEAVPAINETVVRLDGTASGDELVIRLTAARTWVAELGGTSVVAVQCTASATGSEIVSAATLEQVEATLTAVGVDAAVEALGCAADAVPWVGRVLLVPDGEDVPAGWLASDTVRTTLPGVADAAIVCGWGNGAVIGWERLDDATRLEVVSGLADAQHLWHQSDALARRSLRIVGGLGAPTARVKAREVRALLREMEGEWTELANHHLATDDLFLNVQGVRKTVAMATLEAWNYQAAIERITRRMNDTGMVVGRRHERLERRYQSTVEIVLFSLGLLTFLDIVLAAISTAYAGSTETMPGGASNGVFAWLRDVNTDGLLIASLALIGVAAALVVMRRRM